MIGEDPIRPLRWWNPWGFLRLLGWIGFQPSSLHRYIRGRWPETLDEQVRGHWRIGLSIRVATSLIFENIVWFWMLLLALQLGMWPLLPGIGPHLEWVGQTGGILWDRLFTTSLKAVGFGIVTAVAFGSMKSEGKSMAMGVLYGVPMGVVGGVFLLAAGGITASIKSGEAFSVTTGVGLFGVTVGVAVEVVSGVTVSVARSVQKAMTSIMVLSVVIGVIIGIFVGLVSGVDWGVAIGLTGGVALTGSTILMILRPHFWIVESAFLWFSGPGAMWAIPSGWDERTPLPYPYLSFRLSGLLRKHGLSGSLPVLINTLANPGQRWAAQGALRRYLNEVEHPLAAFAVVLTAPNLEDPSLRFGNPNEVRRTPPLRHLLLAEVALRLRPLPVIGEGLFLKLTSRLRDRSPIGWPERAADGYLRLLEGKPLSLALFEPDARFQGSDLVCEQLARLSHAGAAQSVEAIAACSGFVDPAIVDRELPEAFAQVNAALDALQAVASRLAEARDDTRPRALSDGIAACLGELNRLIAGLGTGALPLVEPYKRLVGEAVVQWRDVLTRVGAEVVEQRRAVRLLNPYEVGRPVTGSLFVGRGPILSLLAELWDLRREDRGSVLLFGHRRTGKTSILRNLRESLGENSLCAFVDLQRLAMEKTSAGFLARLAGLIADDLQERSALSVVVPDFAAFLRSPGGAFDEFLKTLKAARHGRPCFVLIDELEVLAEGLESGRYDPSLIEYLRSVIQKEEWLAFAFAARHTFEEQQLHHQGKPLFSSIRLIKVSLLEKDDARAMLERPSDDFDVSYAPEATERILHLSGGQPFVLQLLGWHLVSRLNTLIFDRGELREPRVELADVEAVLGTDRFWNEFAAYGDGVCDELGREATLLLKSFVAKDPGLTVDHSILAGTLTKGDQVGLDRMLKHEIISPVRGRKDLYALTVPVLGIWLLRQPIQDTL